MSATMAGRLAGCHSCPAHGCNIEILMQLNRGQPDG
jgi:hypothetical protein